VPAPVEPPHVGTVLGERYELVRHIARGGMGDVYEARDHLLTRPAAVKVYRSTSATDRSRFEREVRVLARLNHPVLVQVYDAGPHGDDEYVVMELIDGEPLRCGSSGCPPAEVARIGQAVAGALAYVHGEGIVHRDVTPSNILLDRTGRVRLVDFGIMRRLEQPRVTSASIALGTPAFMAPEQVRGEAVGPAADVYALGLVLLELLTGRREFQGTVQEVAIARLARDPDTVTGVPASWRPLLLDMLRRDPAQRSSAADVARRLDLLARDDAPTTLALPATGLIPAFDLAAAATSIGRGPRPLRRRGPSPLALLATAVVAAVIGLILVSGLGDKQPLTPPAEAGTSSTVEATDQAQPRTAERSSTTAPTTAPTAQAADAVADSEDPVGPGSTNLVVPKVPATTPTTRAAPTTTAAPPTTVTTAAPATTAAPPTTGAPATG
jgi:serine/threonine protein kinase